MFDDSVVDGCIINNYDANLRLECPYLRRLPRKLLHQNLYRKNYDTNVNYNPIGSYNTGHWGVPTSKMLESQITPQTCFQTWTGTMISKEGHPWWFGNFLLMPSKAKHDKSQIDNYLTSWLKQDLLFLLYSKESSWHCIKCLIVDRTHLVLASGKLVLQKRASLTILPKQLFCQKNQCPSWEKVI